MGEDTVAAAASQHVVTLTTADFVAAVDRYMDETGSELDALQKRQMKQWRLEWTPAADTFGTVLPANDNHNRRSSPTHCLAGTLEWGGEYLVVVLDVSCCWRQDDDGGEGSANSEKQQSFLEATCTARIREVPRCTTGDDKQQAKIHSKVLKRLRQDDYISKLLQQDEGSTTSTDNTHQLLHAAIAVNAEDGSFEERVDSTSDVAEAIRRAVYTTATAPIDSIDVVCRFPWLPGTEHPLPSTTTLADRAILRLLEDATYDACEEEGDEEIVEDLQITGDEDETKKDEEREPKRHKKKL